MVALPIGWLVAGGWWWLVLVAGGWWLVAGGWWLVAYVVSGFSRTNTTAAVTKRTFGIQAATTTGTIR